MNKYLQRNYSMSRNPVTKVDILAKIYDMKTKVYNGHYLLKTPEWREGAQEVLSEMIEYLKEYRS
jgi:hypothetical protein